MVPFDLRVVARINVPISSLSCPSPCGIPVNLVSPISPPQLGCGAQGPIYLGNSVVVRPGP
jgi:hypothetical protein